MEIKHFDLIVDGHYVQYVPQVFAERFPEWCEGGEEAILRAGPEHELYWDVWDEVSYKERADQSLYTDESGDVFILSDSLMQALITAWESMEALDDCPNKLRGIVQKLAYEFLIDGDEFMSENEALQHFLPSKYNGALINKALEWMRKELVEARNG